jgi:hypothetical protein
MPTSYTSLIGLAKPATGELAGTWGAVVNDYSTEYVDASVAGAQVISGSQTAVTLTVANGVSLTQAGGAGVTGSAQYQVIRCTGNPASTLVITAPASSKAYIVINATSTNQSVTLRGAGPTAGVTIPAGQRAVAVWNGSDFVLSGGYTAFTGDATGAGTSSVALTLSNTGVAAGTYTKLTVDAKGRATSGTTLSSGDLPTYTGTLISSQVTNALGYTPYNSSNPSGFISGITSGMVTTALGYTPYNSSNPSGFISGITSGMVTTALGYTPYNSSNPSGYITSSGSISGNAATATTATTANGLATGNNYQVNSLGVDTAASGTAGEIRATNNVTAYYSSDRRLKENIRDIPRAVDAVEAIGGKLFDWTDKYIESKGGADGYFVQKSDFGVVAQDVQAAFPLAVREREDGTLAVDYEKLCALAFAAIKELSARVKELEAR